MTGPRERTERVAGFSLLELIVALLLLQVGLLAVAGMVFLAQENIRESGRILRAVVDGGWVGDSLLAEGGGGAGQSEREWGTLHWSPGGEEEGALHLWATDPRGTDTIGAMVIWPILPGPGFEGGRMPLEEGVASTRAEGGGVD